MDCHLEKSAEISCDPRSFFPALKNPPLIANNPPLTRVYSRYITLIFPPRIQTCIDNRRLISNQLLPTQTETAKQHCHTYICHMFALSPPTFPLSPTPKKQPPSPQGTAVIQPSRARLTRCRSSKKPVLRAPSSPYGRTAHAAGPRARRYAPQSSPSAPAAGSPAAVPSGIRRRRSAP